MNESKALMSDDSLKWCIFALMSLRLVLMIGYFLVMNSKRCIILPYSGLNSGGHVYIKDNKISISQDISLA